MPDKGLGPAAEAARKEILIKMLKDVLELEGLEGDAAAVPA